MKTDTFYQMEHAINQKKYKLSRHYSADKKIYKNVCSRIPTRQHIATHRDPRKPKLINFETSGDLLRIYSAIYSRRVAL